MTLLERIRGGKKFWAKAEIKKLAPPLPYIPRTAELSARPLKFHQHGTTALFEEMPGTVVDEIAEYRGAAEAH